MSVANSGREEIESSSKDVGSEQELAGSIDQDVNCGGIFTLTSNRGAFVSKASAIEEQPYIYTYTAATVV